MVRRVGCWAPPPPREGPHPPPNRRQTSVPPPRPPPTTSTGSPSRKPGERDWYAICGHHPVQPATVLRAHRSRVRSRGGHQIVVRRCRKSTTASRLTRWRGLVHESGATANFPGVSIEPDVPAIAATVGHDSADLTAPLRRAGLRCFLGGIRQRIAAVIA